MLLNNLMEDKQLNFDQPLLSVRRYAPVATSRRTYDKRKLKNNDGLIRHYIRDGQTSVTNDKSQPFNPRLPPHQSQLKSGPIRNAGAVPFLWEHSPGQPKEDTTPETESCNKPPIAPKLPPGRTVKAAPQDCHPSTIGCSNQAVSSSRISDNDRQVDDVSRDENVERSKEVIEEKESSDSGDSDGAYVDALDTLSRAESSFLNCNMSAMSGLDSSNVKPSGNFSSDVQGREFMMDRFLPAAKAMATETPQYAPKKQTVVVQQQLQPVKKTVNQHKPSLRYGPSFAARYSHFVESEEEESDDEYDQRQNLPSVCGLLPRFCFKSSLCRLNHVPAMSVRTRVPISSAKKVPSSSTGSYSETENESRSDHTEIKTMDKIQRDDIYNDNTKLRNESGQSESHSSSTYRDSPLPFLEDKEVLPVFEENGKGLKTFQELLADQESHSDDPVNEKTVYVDTEQKVESPNVRPSSPTTQHNKVVVVPSSRQEDHEITTKRIDQNPTQAIDSSLEDFKKFCLVSTAKETIEEVNATEQESMELSQAVTIENSHRNNYGLPAPPPLPKSPSDSWLWRTLPSTHAKSSSLRTYLGAATNHEKQCEKAPSNGDMKWETIVKTTKVQRRHLHYSEEVLRTIPET